MSPRLGEADGDLVGLGLAAQVTQRLLQSPQRPAVGPEALEIFAEHTLGVRRTARSE